MILTVTKQFLLLISNIYLYQKILNLYPLTRKKKIPFFIFSLALAFASHLFIIYIPFLTLTTQIILFWFTCLILLHTTPKLSFVASTIVFGFTNALFALISITLITIFYWVSPSKNGLPTLLITFLSGLLTYVLAHVLFKLKRFRKGMSFLYNDFFINSGLFISIIILFSISIIRIIAIPSSFFRALPLTAIFLLGFLLLFWWKNQITKSYIEKLRKAELESLRQELTEKNHEIEKLRENNDALAHIIHRDNKLIPSMEHAVCEFLDNKDALSVDELAQKGEALAKELKEMAASRTGILHDYQAHGQNIPITGVCSVDALLSYMQKKAFSAGITFQVGISADLTAFTTSVVTPEDLSHLLSDLIENAIHAVKDCPDRNIQLHIHNISGNYTVEISDTGVPFPIEILQGYGIEQQTSHADDGGSGIGLMDIWNLKKKYRASMHIQEFDTSSDTWCKKISVIFDSKNHYLIQTYRPEQILMTLKRSDLYVLQL